MSNISSWSTAAASNNSSAPNGFPEGMAPSGLNDSSREVMGAVRRWYDDAEWINYGHAPTYVSASTFTLSGDKRTAYHVGRRVKALDSSSTLYGTIHSCTYTGAASTGVYVTLDTGNFTASLSSISVGIVSFTNTSSPQVTSATYAVSAGDAHKLSGVSATVSAAASQIPVAGSGGRIDGGWLPAGVFVQSNMSSTAATVVCTGFVLDDTIPQLGEPTEVLNVSITPKFASSTLYVFAQWTGTNRSNPSSTGAAIFRDSDADALCAAIQGQNGGGIGGFLMTSVAASSTSATTFKLGVGGCAGTACDLNGSGAATRMFGTLGKTWMLVVEVRG